MRLISTLVCCVVVAAICSGCGERKLQTYPVTGTVKFADGKPLAGGSVEFQSTLADAEGMNARAEIQPDGTFNLSTYRDGDGAVEGEHRVVVFPPPYATDMNMEGPPPAPIIHPKYKSYENSGLKFVVKPIEKNHFEITVEGP